MWGLIFIYFIGKHFYELAQESNQKNKWLYAVLGILVYYIGGYLILLAVLIVGYLVAEDFTDSLSEKTLSFVMIPCGFFACWIFYYLLKKNWNKNLSTQTESIDSIGVEQ